MIVTSKLTLDLARRGVTPRVDAVQDDKYSRDLEITLLSGGEAWAVPEGAAVAVSYVKPDGTVGKYDTLPDGTAAWFAAGNVLTVALAPQVLTCPGLVSMHVHISTGEAVLSTFEIQLVVQRNTAINAESEDYVNMSGFLQIPGQVGQIIQVSAVDADGKVTAVEAVDMPGGESDANVLVVEFTTANLVTGTASHSASEISSAAEAGKLIWGRFSGDANSGVPIDYLGSIDGKARFGITTTNVDFNGMVGATLIYVDDTKTLTITRGTYIMAPEPTRSDVGKTLAVDAFNSVAWQTPSGGVNPVQKTEDMTQRVGVDETGGLWTAPSGTVSGDYIPVPATAAVGQTIVVKEVDESGKPTRWECVDVAVGTAKETTTLADFTLEEDVDNFDVLLNDDPFAYSMLLITITAKCQEDRSGQWIGSMYGGTKSSKCCHLNTVITNANIATVSIRADLFDTRVYVTAHKKAGYLWNTTNKYSYEYDISDGNANSENKLRFIDALVTAGATVKVEGVK